MLCLGRFYHALIVEGKKESENKLVQSLHYTSVVTWIQHGHIVAPKFFTISPWEHSGSVVEY